MASEEGSASPAPMRIRESSCTFEFEIDHSKSKDLPAGTCTSSPTFNAGGYDWAFNYYPRGQINMPAYASFCLILQSEADDMTANLSVQLLSKKGKFVNIGSAYYNTSSLSGHNLGRITIDRKKIEDRYCEDGIIVVSCNIVFSRQKVVKNDSGGLCEHIGKLWEKGERFDVTFEIEGETISAHRLILAARSPVFEATFFGSMAEANMERIKIDEMKAVVFKALLHFVYTDELAFDESSDDAIFESSDDERDSETLSVELLQGLFVAANRYALDKLTLLCEKQLLKNLSVDMVATTLILADQHSRTSLKMKCLNFASSPKNFSLVALTEGYLQIMQGYPTLFAEMSEKVKSSSPYVNKSAKKQKTC